MKLSTITQKYVGKTFEELNCAQFVNDFYTDAGVSLPTSFEGLTLKNYMREFIRNKRKVHGILTKLIKSMGVESSVEFPKIGDLLLIYQPRVKVMFPAVYVGKSSAITSFTETGVTVFKLSELNKAIVARRVL
jgi:hypothetical protein